MKILVLNCGSSSVKFRLFESEGEAQLATGSVEKIGTSQAVVAVRYGESVEREVEELLDHKTALHSILGKMSVTGAPLSGENPLGAVAHRVVHGGEYFDGPALIDADVIEKIRRCVEFAPLHNPHNLRGVLIAQEIFAGVPQIAVFDTAFHHTLPPAAYLYGLPYVLYTRHKIRRYGFHGPSHEYVSRRAARISEKGIESSKWVTCHLGNGASITAVEKGRSVATSMGFTPLEGLVMGTRCGDIDPALVTYLMAKEEIGIQEINTLMNKHSGLLGISGISNDLREILLSANSGNERAQTAIDMFVRRIVHYVGGYIATMNGTDGIIFTGGIGENAPGVREWVIDHFGYLGIQVDKKKNASMVGGAEGQIQANETGPQVWVIATNEEKMIARAAATIV